MFLPAAVAVRPDRSVSDETDAIRRWACCLPQADGLTYLKVGARGAVVGMMNLDSIFQQLHALGRGPDEATDAELAGMARRFNYIPDQHSVVADYAVALRQAYAAFCARQEKGREHATHT